jgi:hypothetical protein
VKPETLIIYSALACAATGAFAQDTPHAECTMFGPQRNQFAEEARDRYRLSALTEQVIHRMSVRTAKPSPATVDPVNAPNLIDRAIFSALRDAAVAPAPKTTDYEFIRRVSLDLTGRVPAPDKVIAFVNDDTPDKRTKLIDDLLNSPEWVDKWTMYFGDRLKNTQRKTQVTMFPQGRDAFYTWIKASLAANKPYDQMAREIIATKGVNSFDPQDGPVNWLTGGRVTGGPVQDIWDQQTANIAETFLGISHVNCLLCHNGRGHLDALSLWGAQTSRMDAWQLASFLSHTDETLTRPDPTNNNLYYWSMQDNVRYKTDYALNTTTGNRPARQPIGTIKTIAPAYIFNGDKPASGENYRDALAREVTGDLQFARAGVNYVWKEFFGRGIVDPVNQFDLARLDPNNPPPDPWTLQPSNPQLLTDLAKAFADGGYSIKGLIRLIVTSETYQLSSRYDGDWNAAWEPLFARKMVRRLWGEEIMDALAQTSGIPASYTIADIGKVSWAMQAPEPLAIGGNFLTGFLPGNRDDEERRGDGAVQQALNLMNDTFVMSRTRSSGSGATASLVARALQGSNEQLVNTLFLTVLSRYPTDSEKSAAIASLGTGNRTQRAEDLLWSLYNKVDFIFNY